MPASIVVTSLGASIIPITAVVQSRLSGGSSSSSSDKSLV